MCNQQAGRCELETLDDIKFIIEEQMGKGEGDVVVTEVGAGSRHSDEFRWQ
jgi:hypothetical protein